MKRFIPKVVSVVSEVFAREGASGAVENRGGSTAEEGLVETVNSVVKRRYGEVAGSRRWDGQFKEVLRKHLIYNTGLA